MLVISKRLTDKIFQYRIQLLWGILIILSVYFIYFVIVNADKQSHGFATYYTASRLLDEREDVSRFYDDDWFSSNVKRFSPEVYEIYHVNLPTTSLIMLPLVKFDYSNARIIWTIFNLIMLFTVVLFLLQKFNYKDIWVPLIIILFLSFQPLYANFLFGQAYIIVFCLLVVAWYAYVSGNEKLLGVAIGLIFVFKSAGFLFWLFLILQQRWKSLVWGLLTVSVVILFSLPWIGIDAWQTYIEKITSLVSNPSSSVTAYQTLHSFFHHLTIFNKVWNPEPLVNLPLLGNLLSIFSVLTITGVSSFIALKNKKSEIVFGAFIIAGVLISPASLDYHYTILLLPFLLLINNIRKDSSAILWVMLLITIFLIAAYLPYASPRFAKGFWAIFAYPKLYGAIGLWGLFIRAAYRSEV